MSHKAQQDYFADIYLAKMPPELCRVLDVGSQDINGSLRDLFFQHKYIGLDIMPGRNVDMVCDICDFKPGTPFDVVVSAEMLEHCKSWPQALVAMHGILRPGGLMILSCAGPGRQEHGTNRSKPEDCPGMKTDYYQNLSIKNLAFVLDCFSWKECGYEYDGEACDTRFWGIRS